MISHGIDWNVQVKILLSRTNVVSHDFINIIYIRQMRDKLNSQNELPSRHRSSVKISQHGEQRVHTLYMQEKSSKMKISIYTYWKLAKPRQFKQWQNTAPQALIDGVNIWTATWLYNIVLSENLASWILDPRWAKRETQSSRLETRSSHLKTRSNQALRCEDRVSSFKCQLTFKRYWTNQCAKKVKKKRNFCCRASEFCS